MPRSVIDLSQTSSPVPATVPYEMGPELVSAIDDAQPDRLRETLRDICNLSSEAAQIAGLLLLDSEPRQTRASGREKRYEGDEDEEEPTESADVIDDDALVDGPRQVKRVRARYATCSNCEEEFEVAHNRKRQCVWHKGEHMSSSSLVDWYLAANSVAGKLTADEDSEEWMDWYEESNGPIDTPENREEYPAGFIYDCCDGDGLSEGCQVTQHVEKTSSNKRARD